MKLTDVVDRFVEVFADKRKLIPLVAVCILCAVLLILVDLAGAEAGSADWRLRVLATVGRVSEIILSAVATVIVLKVLVIQGYFEDAILNIVSGDKWLQLLNDERKRDMWQKLTRNIYVPHLNEQIKTQPNNPQLISFDHSLQDSIQKVFSYKETFYIDRIDINIDVSWANGNTKHKQLCLKNHMTSILIPFDSGHSIEWITSRTVNPGLGIDGYKLDSNPLHLLKSIPPGATVTQHKPIVDGATQNTKFELSGSSSYEVEYQRSTEWPVDLDPSYSYNSKYVVLGGDITIRNNCNGLKILFGQLGGNDLYIPINDIIGDGWINEKKELRRRHAGVLLPGQGFQLTFILAQENSNILGAAT
jgi:hypothetical protein